MLRKQSPARLSADTVPVVRSSPRLKVSKVISADTMHMRTNPPVKPQHNRESHTPPTFVQCAPA